MFFVREKYRPSRIIIEEMGSGVEEIMVDYMRLEPPVFRGSYEQLRRMLRRSGREDEMAREFRKQQQMTRTIVEVFRKFQLKYGRLPNLRRVG